MIEDHQIPTDAEIDAAIAAADLPPPLPVHRVRVTQYIRMQRSIVIEVQADSMEAAIEQTSMEDAPGEGAAWVEDEADLLDERHEPADADDAEMSL